jgi:pimeloyl-ACP methyl ester carboxylesterase
LGVFYPTIGEFTPDSGSRSPDCGHKPFDLADIGGLCNFASVFNNSSMSKSIKTDILDFVQRQKEMLSRFGMGKRMVLRPSGVKVRFFSFESTYDFRLATQVSDHSLLDGSIVENNRFDYPVFFPRKWKKTRKAIVLLHGLNERNWDKYLCWAEYLAEHTRKAVILFPIAYHMNRSPDLWSDPRSMSMLVRKRQENMGSGRSLCFANVALSERLSEDPVRFYTSGRQTIDDLSLLARSLQMGTHPRFKKGTTVDFFAYSIGAFVAEIALMANPDKLFDQSKLFVFCGGALFQSMYGESRCIMDKPAYEKLLDYYSSDWLAGEKSKPAVSDGARSAFDRMIAPEVEPDVREGFFQQLGNRISGISLRKDKVMPFEGVVACMGSETAHRKFELIDFPFDYSHESPFPLNSNIEPALLNDSFNRVFSKAAHFLAS